MNPILKGVIAVVLGWVAGSAVNMGLVQLGYTIFPVEGLDPNDMESLAALIPTLESKHFVFPFLAHALGTLVGAVVAGLLAPSHHMRYALGIGALFLAGGIYVNYLIPGPTWFTILDIVVAYIPMAWIGGTLASNKVRQSD